MHFLTIFSIATASFASASSIPNDAFSNLLSKADQVQQLLNFNVMDKAKFTKEDFSKLLPSLMNDANIRELLVNDKVSFSLTGLSVPEKEANKILVDAVTGNKALLNIYVRSYVSTKTNSKNIEGTKQEFRNLIEELSKDDGKFAKGVEKVDEILAKHPELASIIRYLITAMPETFDKEGLDFAKLFLTEVHASNPELVLKLATIVDMAQSKYKFLPEPQFNNLREVLASFN
ncbi:hypothetical protein DSO57_1026785 [Entomophthora muscae]|uniref:Uncharacterized protein n=1 Tax=Entomophthora muscae TaxID=34485 RepID=A0ACC2T1T7_9FUNG|nr:hypothetical protein DSO57_1026785 [Entomophthora muscae]